MTNFLLVLFTAALVVLAYTQVRFFARKERAFVFPDPVDLSIVNAPDDMVRGWRFAVVWKNTGESWSRFVRQAVKVDLMTRRTIHHEDAQTVHGRVQGKGCA